MTLLRPNFLATAVIAACLANASIAQAAPGAAGAGSAGAGAGTAATGAAGTSSNTNPLAASVNTPSATTTPTGSNLISGGDAFSGSSRGAVPPVGPAAVDANGVNVNGFGSGLQSGATTSAGVNGAAVNGINGVNTTNATNAATGNLNSPFSSDVGTGVIYPGAPYGVTDATGMTSGSGTAPAGGGTSGSAGNAYGSAGNAAGANANAFTAAGIATPQLDAATRREARRERATVARGGQTLNTIAPRTNVDRTSQMPDDPLSPALSPPDRPVVRY